MDGTAGDVLRRAASDGFVQGFGLAMVVGALLLAAGAVLILRGLPSKDVPDQPLEAPRDQEPAALVGQPGREG